MDKARHKTLLWVWLCCIPLLSGGFAQKQQRDLRLDVPASTLPDKPDRPGATPNYYALIIGIGKYPDLKEEQQLQYTVRDAESVYSVLIPEGGGNFPAENIRLLIDSEATRKNIHTALEEWLPSKARSEDTVLIYFAGHGFLLEGGGYLAPFDFRIRDWKETAYPMQSLGKILGESIRAKNRILLTDACHSGAIFPGSDSQSLASSLLQMSRSVFSLTASRDREQSFESPQLGGGHGFFTYFLVNGLQGQADENGDAVITADELAEFVHRHVRTATGGKQNPTSDRGSFDPNLPLASLSRSFPGSPGRGSAPETGTLLIEADMDELEVFVGEESRGLVFRDRPLRLPGFRPGPYRIKAVKMGFEPDGPREETVYPGQETRIRIRSLVPKKKRSSDAEAAFSRGVQEYLHARYAAAARQLEKVLAADAADSQAALYLGRVYHASGEMEKAEVFFRRAVEIDPDFLEARIGFGGMLLGMGNIDESIRQYSLVLRREPRNAQVYYHLAQAYRMKNDFGPSISHARKAIEINPQLGESHFWLAESLRMSGGTGTLQKPLLQEARKEYLTYLQQSEFESKAGEKAAAYLSFFLLGHSRTRSSSQRDIWKSLRSLAYFGLGDCEFLLGQTDPALQYYKKSLAVYPQDAQVHHKMARVLCTRAEYLPEGKALAETLQEARAHFQSVLEINPDIVEAAEARKYISKIDLLLKASRP